MKKKIFFMSLMIVALICVLAISVFADDRIVSKTENEEYGTVIQLNSDPGLDNASQYVSTLKKINDSGDSTQDYCILTDGTYFYVFPSSYIVDEREDGRFELIATQLATAMAEFNTANGTSYYEGYAITGSGGGKRLDAIVRFEFPSDVTNAHRDYCCMRSYPNLLEVRFNHPFDITNGANLFQQSKKLQTVVGFETVSGTMPNAVFAGCVNLGDIKLPTNMTNIPQGMFQSCNSGNLNIVNLSELTQLTTIGAWAFDGTQKLVITLPDSVTTLNTSAFESAFKQGGSITINPTSQLTTIGTKAFSGSTMLDSIYIPSTVTSIGEYAFSSSGIKTLENFENCQITTIKAYTFEAVSNLTSIKIPETVTTIENAFLGNKSLTKVYIPTSVTWVADTFVKSTWVEAPANITILYIGTDASIFADCARITGATVINASDYVETNTYTGVNLVVGYSHCVAYNNGVHQDKTDDIIVTSFLEDIKVVSKCNLCGMYDENGKISALFVCLGYSAPEYGTGGIAIGFMVDDKAVSEYEAITEKTVRYGVFAVSQYRLGDNDIFGEDGTASEGVVSANMTAYETAAFELKITGFTDEQKDTKLAMGAYVAVTDGETTEYSYMQGGEPNENEKYSFVSYNDVVKSTSKE